jgi:pimeloyl-ACP methyl ester carboxylesterase
MPSQEMIARLSSPVRNLEIGEAARRSVALVMAPGYAESHSEEMSRVVETVRYRPQSQTSYLRQLQAALFHDVVDQVERIMAPALVIHGEDDPLIPAANGRYLAAHIPGAHLILYSSVGHIPIIECAEQYNRDVLAFLDQ